MNTSKSEAQVQQGVELLRAQSQEFAKRATGLSETLSSVEKWLIELEGKVEANVPMEGDLVLRFERVGQTWRLAVNAYNKQKQLIGSSPLATATVESKIKAAKNLPALVARMAELHAERMAEIVEAQKVLADMGVATATSGKGGA